MSLTYKTTSFLAGESRCTERKVGAGHREFSNQCRREKPTTGALQRYGSDLCHVHASPAILCVCSSRSTAVLSRADQISPRTIIKIASLTKECAVPAPSSVHKPWGSSSTLLSLRALGRMGLRDVGTTLPARVSIQWHWTRTPATIDVMHAQPVS